MRIYDNAIKDGLKRLQAMAPDYYKGVLEAEEIWRALGDSLNEVRDNIISCVDANLIKRCGLCDIEEYEKFLGIRPDAEDTLQERRSVVAARYTGLGHIGAGEIIEIVSLFMDGVCEVEFSEGTITVKIYKGRAQTFPYKSCLSVLKTRIPAHLALNIIYVDDIETAVFTGAAGSYHGCITIGYKED